MSKEKEQKQSKRWIIPLLILLILLVFISGIILGTRIGKFTDVEPYTEVIIGEDSDKDKDKDKKEEFVPEPGIMLGGMKADGSIDTKISIFRASYSNESEEITVRSLGKDKVVAPGTSNSHKIRIQNTGNCAMDYELNVQDLFPNTAQDREVPIEIRMTDYRGRYVLGGTNKWISLENLDVVCDTGTVGKGNYVYYTLEWRWPFEVDENADIYDTLLGTLSNSEQIECGITLKTTAEMNPDPNAEGGFWAPQTGDYMNTILWASLLGVSLVLLILLLIKGTKKRNKEE